MPTSVRFYVDEQERQLADADPLHVRQVYEQAGGIIMIYGFSLIFDFDF